MKNKDMFTKAVENIGSLNSLIAVMQNYNISFKKDSSGYFTNCMFHNDNTPSLRLTDKGKKAIYKCFGIEYFRYKFITGINRDASANK